MPLGRIHTVGNAERPGWESPATRAAQRTATPIFSRSPSIRRARSRSYRSEGVRFIAAEDAYVKIQTADEAFLLREQMHGQEDPLDAADFAHIRCSTNVRLALIETVLHGTGGDYTVRLKTGENTVVSQSCHEGLMAQPETSLA